MEPISGSYNRVTTLGEKLGRKGKNREGSFTLPLLTDRAGYATAMYYEATRHLLGNCMVTDGQTL